VDQLRPDEPASDAKPAEFAWCNARRRFPHGKYATGDKIEAPRAGANGSLKKNRRTQLNL